MPSHGWLHLGERSGDRRRKFKKRVLPTSRNQENGRMLIITHLVKRGYFYGPNTGNDRRSHYNRCPREHSRRSWGRRRGGFRHADDGCADGERRMANSCPTPGRRLCHRRHSGEHTTPCCNSHWTKGTRRG